MSTDLFSSLFSSTTRRSLLPVCSVEWIIEPAGSNLGCSCRADMLFINSEDRLQKLGPNISLQLLFSSELEQLVPEIRFNVGFDVHGLLSRYQSLLRCRGYRGLRNLLGFFEA